MIRTVAMSLMFAVVAATAGCLQKETTHTIYLAPDGAVSWVISELNVRSDEQEADKRIAEEQTFIGAALLGSHGAARGLAALRPEGLVRTTILRDERPFQVVTDARFTAVDRLLERLFTELGIRTSSSLTAVGSLATLRVQLDFSRPLRERKSDAAELVEALDRFRFVLTDGRFDTATGFDLVDGASATLSSDWLERADLASESGGRVDLMLSWTR